MKEERNIVILHGWGLQSNVYKRLALSLEKRGYSVYVPDLPGFGNQPLLSPNMKLEDYALFLRRLIKDKNIKHPVLIGHSFGGRVALKYVSKYPGEVYKLILTGVPIIRNNNLKKRVAFVFAGFGRLIFRNFTGTIRGAFRKLFYYILGEWDYYKAGTLKEIFKNIIAEDLTKYSLNIKIPTLLVWGEKDSIVPVYDIEKIKILIPHAQSIIVRGAGHKLPYENASAFLRSIKAFV